METFHRQFAPLTFKIGFLEAQLLKVATSLKVWRQKHFHNLEMSHISGELDRLLLRLPPLSTPPRRSIVVKTSSIWSAYFDNGVNGPDPFGPIVHLSDALGCRGLIATYVPHTLNEQSGMSKGSYGAIQFELFGPNAGNPIGCIRSISVSFDGDKWSFDANGEVLPFEFQKRYKEPKIVDRFTIEMLDEYCQAVGVRPFDPSFYQNDAYLISISDPLATQYRQMSLAEAQREFGLI
jgi:hypothetical protein